MQSEKSEDLIIDSIGKHFKSKAKDFTVKSSTNIPSPLVSIEITLYNFLVIRIVVEKNTAFFSIVQSDFLLDLFKIPAPELEKDAFLLKLDEEVKLRIPDKYLIAKGWKI